MLQERSEGRHTKRKLSQCIFYITTLAIMQDCRDNKNKQLKMTASRPFWILFLRNLWVILVCVLKFCSLFKVQLLCFVFALRNHPNLLKFKMAAKRKF